MTKAKNIEKKKKELVESIPFKTWDIDHDTLFVQYLNIPNIEILYKRLNLVDFNKVADDKYLYIKGCIDTIHALIGIDNNLKKLIDSDPSIITNESIDSHISAITRYIRGNLEFRKTTEEAKVNYLQNSPEKLLEHINGELINSSMM